MSILHDKFVYIFATLGLIVTPMQQKAFEFYKKNSLSIEIIKDDVLQKVNFRVRNKVSIYKHLADREFLILPEHTVSLLWWTSRVKRHLPFPFLTFLLDCDFEMDWYGWFWYWNWKRLQAYIINDVLYSSCYQSVTTLSKVHNSKYGYYLFHRYSHFFCFNDVVLWHYYMPITF